MQSIRQQKRPTSNSTTSPTAGATACRNGRRRRPQRATLQFHAKDGVWCSEFEGIMHRGTHMDAPIHVTRTRRRSPAIRSGASSAPASWSRSRRASGASSPPRISRRRAEDPQERHRDDQHRQPPQARRQRRLLRLFARPLQRGGRMDGRAQVKLVGIDVQALDHPLGTLLGPHGPGPAQPHLDGRIPARDRPRHHRGLSRTGSRRTRS